MFDRAIINNEKGYVFETDGFHGVATKIKSTTVRIELPILVSPDAVRNVEELFTRIADGIDGARIVIDLKQLKNLIDKMGGEGAALLHIVGGVIPIGDDKFGRVIVLRTDNAVGVASELSNWDDDEFYAPWIGDSND